MGEIDGVRKSHMEIGSIYFWTTSIFKRKWLLYEDSWKLLIVDSLRFLSRRGLVDVFGFVIMPNHIHLVWRLNAINGKEKPDASLLKFTSHQFKKNLKLMAATKDPIMNSQSSRTRKRDTAYLLDSYFVNKSNKEYQFWKRDPLAVELIDLQIAYQKLDYIHHNPLLKDWFTSEDPAKYRFSSCSFYEDGLSEFDFLKHLGEEY